MKSYENHDKPVIQKTPFLPSNDHFNIIWIETRNCDPKPFITFKITEEKSSLKIERPLKIILDFVKLKIGTRFMKKLFEEIDIPKANLKKPHVENSEFPENEAVNRNFDLFRSIFHSLELETSQLVFLIQLYKSAIQVSVDKIKKLTKLEPHIESKISFTGLRVQIKTNFSRFQGILGPGSGELKFSLHNVPHSSSLFPDLYNPRIVAEFDSEALVFTLPINLMDKLNDLLHDVNDLLPDGSRKSSIRPKSPVKTPLKHTKQEFKNDFHSGGFSFVTDEIWTEKSKAGKLIFESDSNGSRVTWRYKELRSLMGMKFTPVPINRTSDSTTLVINDSIPVELQFYDSLLLQFVTLKTFNVRELDPVTIDLSNVKIVSSTWRFKMSHFPDLKIQPLSAFALVGSCTLDSIYAPENISNMTLSLNLQNIVIGIEKEVQIRFTKVSTVVEKWPEVTKLHSKQFIRVKALDNKSLRMISVLDKNFTEVGINIFDGNRSSKTVEFEVGMDDIKVFINQRILQTLSRLLQQKKSRSFYYLENRTCCDVTISQSRVRRVQKIPAYTTGDLFIPYPNDNFQLNLKSDGIKPDQINRNLNLYKIGSSEQNKKFDSGVEVYQDGNKFVVEGCQALLNETKFTITLEAGFQIDVLTSDWLSNQRIIMKTILRLIIFKSLVLSKLIQERLKHFRFL